MEKHFLNQWKKNMGNKLSLKISTLAQIDLENIFKYISTDLNNPTSANKLIDEIYESLDKVCIFPKSCPLISNELTKRRDLRKLIVDNYIVIYYEENLSVVVVRVFNEKMDYTKYI